MTRIRQWLVSLALAALLMLSFAPVASADPSDPGTGFSSTSTTVGSSDQDDPRGKKISRSSLLDPSDPGTGY